MIHAPDLLEPRIFLALGLSVGVAAVIACSSDAFTPSDGGADASIDVEAGPDVGDAAIPDGPSCGTSPRYVFLSSTPHEGSFDPIDAGPLSGADSFCKALADGAGSKVAGRKWVAWLSRETLKGDARLRLGLLPNGDFPVTYELVDGTEIFPKGFNFDVVGDAGQPSLPSASITKDERGSPYANVPVWTGTAPAGTAVVGQTCGGWTALLGDSGVTGVVGQAGNIPQWSQSGDLGPQNCLQSLRVYCFEVCN